MRSNVPMGFVTTAVEIVAGETVKLALLRKNMGLASNYEITGVVMEEFSLYTAAVMRGDQAAAQKKLIDVARAATFGVACQLAKTVDS